MLLYKLNFVMNNCVRPGEHSLLCPVSACGEKVSNPGNHNNNIVVERYTFSSSLAQSLPPVVCTLIISCV